MNKLTHIAFDADDTLWHHERYYHFTQVEFAKLLSNHAQPDHISQRLLAAEQKNLKFYGFGVKGFTLSMIETAIEVTDGKMDAKTIARLLEAGREMLSHPIELMPKVQETLATLSGDYKILLITKGDLFDQERKLAASGLGDYFHGVEIVSDKTPDVYTRIFKRHGTLAQHGLMAGNSLKSDILPMLKAGGIGVHVPHEYNWALDHAELPEADDRLHVVKDLAGVIEIVNRLTP